MFRAIVRNHPSSWSRCRLLSTTRNYHNPFDILGIPPSAPFSEAKRAFIRLALEHHPDMKRGDGGGGADASNSAPFVKIRKAFEDIQMQSTVDGKIQIRPSINKPFCDEDDVVLAWTDEQLSPWFFQETGVRLSFSMKEVADVTNNLSPGGLDRGGYWDMAKTIARQRKEKNHDDILMVSSGTPSCVSGSSSGPTW